jgi:nucleoid-associated protein YgaU
LWRIAQTALGPGCTPAEVARAWPRWWAANHAVVGTDPDLIHPGQLLVPPTAPTTDSPEENR